MSTTGNRIDVLHVDDQPTFADTAAEFLEREDDRIAVQTETSAREGLERLEEADIDCIVSDYEMPRQDGIEFLETVREDHPDLPFILYTGKGSEEIASKAISAGVTDYLQKGMGTDQYTILANRVLNAVESHRSRKQLAQAERKYRTLFDEMIDGAAIHELVSDADGNPVDYELIDANRNFESILGIPKESAVGKRASEIYQADDPPFLDTYANVVETGDSAEFESFYPPLEKHFHIAVFSPEPGQFVTVFSDVTDRKAERERLELLESLENQLTELARDLLQTHQGGVEAKLNEALGTIGTLVEADRSYLFQINHDDETLSNTHEWTADGIEPQIDQVQAEPLQTFPWLLRELRESGPVAIPDVSDLPPEAEDLQRILRDQNIRSLILAPMKWEDELVGFIGFDWVNTQEAWSDDFVRILRISGEIVVSALQRESRRRELEQREAYLEQSSDIISVLDADGNVKYQSESTERVTAFTPGEVVGKSGFEHVHPDDRDQFEAKFHSFVDQPDDEIQVELRVETNTGSWKWIEVRGVNKLNDPVIDGLLFSSREISARKERERDLRALKERYESFVEYSSDIVTVTDEEGTITFESSAGERVLGYDPDARVGESVFECIHPDDRQTAERRFQAILDQNTDATERTEVRYKHADGSYRWLESIGIDRTDSEIDGLVFYSRDITERKEREQEVQTLTERFELAVDGATLGIWDWDMGTDDVEYNEQWADMLGYSLDEIEPHLDAWEQRVHPDDVPEVQAALDEHIADETNFYESEYRMRTADGNWMWVRAIGRIVNRDEDGEPVRAVGIHLDITDRKEHERELTRHRAFLRESMDIVAVLEPDGTFQYITPSIERILGYEPDDLVDEPAFDLAHPDDRDVLQETFVHLLDASEITQAPDARFRTADSDWRWLEIRATDQRDNPAIEGIVVNARDVTSRKRREDALAELHDAATSLEEATTREDVYDILVEAAAEILEFDVVVVSAVEGEALVYRASTLTSDTDGYYEQAPLDEDFLATRAFRRGETIIADDLREYDVTPAKPEYRSALTVPIGEVGVFQSVSRQANSFDETDRELAELLVDHAREALQRLEYEGSLRDQQERLRRENERLDRFASVLSHDLRNPLTIANGELDLAREECDSQHLGEVAWAHVRIDSIIDDVLTMARDGQAVQADELEWIDLEDLSEECWRTVETDNADLDIACDSAVHANRERLRRVFENLFRNAVEHCSTSPPSQAHEDTGSASASEPSVADAPEDAVEHGSTSARSEAHENALEHPGETVTITIGELEGNGFYVADDGPGIPEHEREHVFESGYSRSETGTGFGLSIAKEMVAAHDWEITVTESEAGGARFDITGVEMTTDVDSPE